MKRYITWLTFGAVVAIVGLVMAVNPPPQNPPVIAEPAWDSPETRALAERACFDCHSNETKWPLYTRLPVIRQLIVKHVNEGRRELNVSEWGTGRKQEGSEAADKVFEPLHYAENDLPQPSYAFMHPKARLSDSERQALAAGLTATLGEGRPEGEDRDD